MPKNSKQIYQVTKANFRQFTHNCRFWQHTFGVTDYRISLYHHCLHDEGDCASTGWNAVDRTGVITLNTTWSVPVTREELDAVALHEIIHLILGDLTDVANQRFLLERDIDKVLEAAVVRLENGIRNLIYGGSK